MNKSLGPGRLGSAKRIIDVLSELVRTLPTAEEKRQIHDALQAVIEFLRQAQKELDAIPSRDELRQLSEALYRLENILKLAEDNPLLARPLGFRPKALIKAKSAERFSADEIKAVLKKFASMTIDQIRQYLTEDSDYSRSHLRALGMGLGIRVQARMSREALANQITTRIANERGYNKLSGD